MDKFLQNPLYYVEKKHEKNFLGAVLGGVASAVVGGLLSKKGSSDQNKANAALQEDAQDFNVTAAKNKHQWEVEDLKSAGLNPVLSANSGASVAGSPLASAPANELGNAVNSALSTMRLASEIDNLNADTKLKTDDAQLKRDQSSLALAQVGHTNTQSDRARVETRAMELGLPAKLNDARFDSSRFDRDWET